MYFFFNDQQQFFFSLNVCFIYIFLMNTEYLKKKFEQRVFFVFMFL